MWGMRWTVTGILAVCMLSWFGVLYKYMENMLMEMLEWMLLWLTGWFGVVCTRASTLRILGTKAFKNGQNLGVTWLDVDHVDQRYMLAGSSSGAISLYDTQAPKKGGEKPCAPLSFVDRASAGGHQYLVSGVAWYPVDTGLFVSGSFDAQVNVWDTNKMEVACQFDMGARVYSVAMSPIASSHCLIAVGSEDPLVKLCDPSSGGFSHTLEGHKESVWAVHWSLRNEFELITGGMDGQIHLWDIRRSGRLTTFNQHHTRKKQVFGEQFGLEDNSERRSRGLDIRAAHDGHITAIKPTPDGLYWISAATDSRVRLWDGITHKNMLVNYASTWNRSMKARQMGVSSDSEVFFHPSGSVVQVFDLSTGQLLDTLRAHMDTINCCIFNPSMHELYSGSNDGNILVWRAALDDKGCNMDIDDDDDWSDA